VRRGFVLYLYTGQRGSDAVRIGRIDVDDNGIRLTQQKTMRPVWCPIVHELEAEMRTWEKKLGPFLQREDGTTFTRASFWEAFDKQRAEIPELKETTLHGLRCTAVIRLRMAGLSNGQIGDITGMSLQTIARYCRCADLKLSGQAALVHLQRNRTLEEQNCKTVENRKT
jgi:integrase